MTLNVQYLLDAVLGLAAIAWICYRQMTWRVVDPARMWRGPLIFAIVGVGIIVTGSKTITFTTLDIALLAVELAIALGAGAAMGAIAHFRLLSRERAAAYEANRRPSRTGGALAPVEYESRTSWVGVALWFVMIAVRVGLEFYGQHMGAAAGASTGIILLVLAANRVARTAVLAWRLEQHRQQVATLAR
ncbi:hypothetical protein [Gryllotalpicola protaetiae]|uniref:DUF1453 family protein n=1 Tax=Gryllotalpicola protaetiae TaxID=2419771 RepID=A0A387BLX1_9MICO|nr:hypothetical protein [Gryllotalpicola protaetiae]AYG03024.1 hypothetical protein D7I44_05445 [Gryllotalpicola protaetiae]